MITNAWQLTMICYDDTGRIDDPEELFTTLERGPGINQERFLGERIRCALVTPCK